MTSANDRTIPTYAVTKPITASVILLIADVTCEWPPRPPSGFDVIDEECMSPTSACEDGEAAPDSPQSTVGDYASVVCAKLISIIFPFKVIYVKPLMKYRVVFEIFRPGRKNLKY